MAEAASREGSIKLACHPAAPSVARRFARRLAPPDTAATVELLVSELVTNAVLHARSDVELRICVCDGGIRVEVHDRSRQLPALAVTERVGNRLIVNELVDHGRGLQLVEALATHWGSRQTDTGKSVWFEVVDPRPAMRLWSRQRPGGLSRVDVPTPL